MPTYSYACTQCDNRFDIVQSFSDDSLTVCPECSGRLRKLFNSVGIVFKGSGFYRTDSRSGSTVNAQSSDSKSESSSESKSDSKSDSKSSDSKAGDSKSATSEKSKSDSSSKSAQTAMAS